jgi:hypothetical protein
MTEQNPDNKKVTIYNKITEGHNAYHADGAYAGVTPQGLINLNFFSERVAIPKSSDFKITDNNLVGEHLGDSDDSKKGIIREFDVGVYMSIPVAKALTVVLLQKIKEAENQPK